MGIAVPLVTLHVTTDEPQPVDVTVDSVFGFRAMGFTDNIFPMTGTVSHGESLVFKLPSPITAGGDDIRVNDNTQLQKSLRVKAADGKKISVYGRSEKTASSDAFMALPCVDYPTGRLNYLLMSNTVGEGSSFNSLALIVTCERNADIRLRSDVGISIPPAIGPSAGGGIEVRLNIPDEGTTLLLEAGSDLTGTTLRSNVPLVVYSGHECSQIPTDLTACDSLVEQIPPHPAWGNLFFIIPFRGRFGDQYRVGSFESNNVIQITCTPLGASSAGTTFTQTLAAREVQTFSNPISSTPEFCCIETSKPAIVTQYSFSHSVDFMMQSGNQAIGDPFMLLVPPATQFLNNYTLTDLAEIGGIQFSQKYINVAIVDEFFDERDILVNGMQATPLDGGYVPIYCSGGRICGYGGRFDGTGINTVAHSDKLAGINAFQYGYGIEISYGYPGGMEMEGIGCKLTLRMHLSHAVTLCEVEFLWSSSIQTRLVC